MNIQIKWTGKQNFEGIAADGQTVSIRPNKDQEGTITPPDLLLMSLGSCTGLFLLPAAKTMKVEMEDFEITVKGVKAETPPKLFDKIKIHVAFKGNMTEDQAKELLEKSHEKCFILTSLNPNIEIESSVEVK